MIEIMTNLTVSDAVERASQYLDDRNVVLDPRTSREYRAKNTRPSLQSGEGRNVH